MAKQVKGLKSQKASSKAKSEKKLIVVSKQLGTGISTRVFDAKTGEFLYSSWVNKNLKPLKPTYKRK